MNYKYIRNKGYKCSLVQIIDIAIEQDIYFGKSFFNTSSYDRYKRVNQNIVLFTFLGEWIGVKVI